VAAAKRRRCVAAWRRREQKLSNISTCWVGWHWRLHPACCALLRCRTLTWAAAFLLLLRVGTPRAADAFGIGWGDNGGSASGMDIWALSARGMGGRNKHASRTLRTLPRRRLPLKASLRAPCGGCVGVAGTGCSRHSAGPYPAGGMAGFSRDAVSGGRRGQAGPYQALLISLPGGLEDTCTCLHFPSTGRGMGRQLRKDCRLCFPTELVSVSRAASWEVSFLSSLLSSSDLASASLPLLLKLSAASYSAL